MGARFDRPVAAVWFSTLVLLAACGPSDPIESVRAVQDSGDVSATLEPLRLLIAERPRDPEVQYRYGLALLATGQPALALWPLRRAAEAPEWESRANHALAAAYLMAGSHDEAIAVIGRELERDPENVAALLLRANARIQSRRDYEAALADAERILELDPENANALAPRAVALLALDRVEEASAAIDELESLHRDDALDLHGSPGYCIARAKFAEEKGDTSLAEQRYGACLERFPSHGALLQQAMDFFDRSERAERATELLRAALAAVPEAQAYRIALAGRLRAQKRPSEAEQVLREGTEHPDPIVAAEAWAGLARFLIDGGDYSEGVAAYQEVRRLAGPDDSLLFATADALVIAGRSDEALELAEQISSAAYRGLIRGRAAFARGDAGEALRHFDEGIRLWPDNPFARYYSALAAERVGDFERAIEDYRYAMRIDARATDAYLRLARLQEAAGRPELALAALSFMPGGRPFEDEAALFEIRLLARLGRSGQAPPALLHRLAVPERRAAAAAALAAGVRERAGAEAAVKAIRGVEDLDLVDPAHPEALEALVDHLARSGRAAEAVAALERPLASHPDAAVFHALRGRALAARGARAEAHAAFERALALDPAQRVALLGLAQVESTAGAHGAALALYERALALDPDDAASGRGLAAELVELDRSREAEERLATLLHEHPCDAKAAMALAELRMARGARDERTRELLRRAVFFGGAAEAKRLLERVESQTTERTDASHES